MHIKQSVKISFALIALSFILIAAINFVVITQIKDNNFYKKHIEQLSAIQLKMNSLSKDLLKSNRQSVIDKIKANFIGYENEFNKEKNILTLNKKNSLLDKIVLDIHKNKKVSKDLEHLYKNEKITKQRFLKAYNSQKEKIALENKFSNQKAIENKLIKKFKNITLIEMDIYLFHIFGQIKHYKEETLFIKKDEKSLNTWLEKIDLLKKKSVDLEKLNEYKNAAKNVGQTIVKINKIDISNIKLLNKNIELIGINKRLYSQIDKNIEKLLSQFINSIYLYIFILLFFTITFIVFISYRVSKNVGLSVNEIEEKVHEGLKEIQALNQEIEVTQKEVVFTMGAIGESRSKETGHHVKRVAEYTKLLALEYGLEEKEAEMLKQASPMHDIGKIAIPDFVLNKPGLFNDEERAIMDTHAQLGYDMLKGSNRELLVMASIVAYEHHEKWDGSGYPQKNSGEDIHIYGRITAVADVFDALGSERVYKKAWDDEKIFNFFKEERGVHFDPSLIDIFFENLDKFLEIRDKFKD